MQILSRTVAITNETEDTEGKTLLWQCISSIDLANAFPFLTWPSCSFQMNHFVSPFCCLLLPVCADDTWLPYILNNPSGLWWNVAYKGNSTWHRQWTTNCTNWFASGHVNCVRVAQRSFRKGKVTASALCHRTQPSHKLTILCPIDWPQPSQLAIQFNWLTSFSSSMCALFSWTCHTIWTPMWSVEC